MSDNTLLYIDKAAVGLSVDNSPTVYIPLAKLLAYIQTEGKPTRHTTVSEHGLAISTDGIDLVMATDVKEAIVSHCQQLVLFGNIEQLIEHTPGIIDKANNPQ